MVKRNASQFARVPGAVRGKRFFRVRVELASVYVLLNLGVELCRVKGLEPHAKPRQLAWGKLFDGFLDVFGSGHLANIAFASDNA